MSDSKPSLVSRIHSREAKIGVIGLGYVGLPLGLEFTAAGFPVVGYDIHEDRVKRLRQGDSYVNDVSDDVLANGLSSGFNASDNPSFLEDCDVFIIAVPTDVWHGAPDLSAVEDASETIAAQSGSGEILTVVTSTVHPGATREVVEPIVTADRPDGSMHVAMVPERLDPGSDWDLSDIPLVVGADTEPTLEAASTLFEAIVTDVHPVNSTATAEFAKTLENTYRMVNIALVNELALLAERTEADLWASIEAASTKPFGFQAFVPGPGVGGHCIPVDPQFLTWRARNAGTELPLVERANDVNRGMPSEVVDRIHSLLNGRDIDPNNATIVALGATYKANVADVRNSPALEVISELADTVNVAVVDPHVRPSAVPASEVVLSIEDLSFDLADADLVVLLVDHDGIDIETVSQRAPLVFDTRNVVPSSNAAEVIQLGDGSSPGSLDGGNPAENLRTSPRRASKRPGDQPTPED